MIVEISRASLWRRRGETCVPSNPIPNGSVWGTTTPGFVRLRGLKKTEANPYFSCRVQNLMDALTIMLSSYRKTADPVRRIRQICSYPCAYFLSIRICSFPDTSCMLGGESIQVAPSLFTVKGGSRKLRPTTCGLIAAIAPYVKLEAILIP